MSKLSFNLAHTAGEVGPVFLAAVEASSSSLSTFQSYPTKWTQGVKPPDFSSWIKSSTSCRGFQSLV